MKKYANYLTKTKFMKRFLDLKIFVLFLYTSNTYIYIYIYI